MISSSKCQNVVLFLFLLSLPREGTGAPFCAGAALAASESPQFLSPERPPAALVASTSNPTQESLEFRREAAMIAYKKIRQFFERCFPQEHSGDSEEHSSSKFPKHLQTAVLAGLDAEFHRRLQNLESNRVRAHEEMDKFLKNVFVLEAELVHVFLVRRKQELRDLWSSNDITLARDLIGEVMGHAQAFLKENGCTVGHVDRKSRLACHTNPNFCFVLAEQAHENLKRWLWFLMAACREPHSCERHLQPQERVFYEQIEETKPHSKQPYSIFRSNDGGKTCPAWPCLRFRRFGRFCVGNGRFARFARPACPWLPETLLDVQSFRDLLQQSGEELEKFEEA